MARSSRGIPKIDSFLRIRSVFPTGEGAVLSLDLGYSMPADAWEISRQHLWRKLFLVLGLLWAVAVVAPDFLRLHDFIGPWNLASFGFLADNDGTIYVVDDGPAKLAGLTTHDSIPLRTSEGDGPPGAGA